MPLDAIVLAGGRSSRLSGVPKSQLPWRGTTLLQNTVDAALDAGARRVVVVGPTDGPDAQGSSARNSDARVQFAREEPPFGGPAAAVAAGIGALEHELGGAADIVLVLACDMPEVGGALSVLIESMLDVGHHGAAHDGALMLDSSGRRQPLASVYGRRALARAVDGLRASGTLDGASMRSLTSGLDLLELPDDAGWTRDIDTWGDAAAFGIATPDDASFEQKESTMSDDGTTEKPDMSAAGKPPKPERSEAEKAEMLDTLERWSASLASELGIADIDVDIDALLALAGVAAHAVLRPAAPLTTYLVGYAAGRASAAEGLTAAQATARATEVASALARRRPE
jgi:CTP:molybdopterin cytidylyltransferase MocA